MPALSRFVLLLCVGVLSAGVLHGCSEPPPPEPLPLDRLRFATEREQEADRLVTEGAVEVTAEPQQDGRRVLSGTVRDGTQTFEPTLTIDADERIVAGSCSCHYFVSNKLMKGPCVHMLALRRAHAQRGRFAGRLD